MFRNQHYFKTKIHKIYNLVNVFKYSHNSKKLKAMTSKTTNTEFYLNQLKRIAKSEKIKSERDAIIKLAKYLEKHTRFILKRAKFFANKEKRKIIKTKDIEQATKEGILITD